jgi:hypothetical protein
MTARPHSQRFRWDALSGSLPSPDNLVYQLLPGTFGRPANFARSTVDNRLGGLRTKHWESVAANLSRLQMAALLEDTEGAWTRVIAMMTKSD